MSLYSDCLVPRRLSLDENVRAKEGGKKTTAETIPFPCSLAVHNQSLASRLIQRVRKRTKKPWKKGNQGVGDCRKIFYNFFLFIFFFNYFTLYFFFLYFVTHDIYPRPTKFSFSLDLLTQNSSPKKLTNTDLTNWMIWNNIDEFWKSVKI